MAGRAVVVYGAGQAGAAARASERLAAPALVLMSAADGATSGGPGWFLGVLNAAREAAPGIAIDGVLRCGNAPGLALAAVRCGVTLIELDRDNPAHDRVKAIARKMGARLVDTADWDVLELGQAEGEAAETLVSAWISNTPR